MGRLNIEPLMILPDGSSLVISTESRDGEFSCALYRVVETDDRAVFHVVSKHFPPAPTCLSAQEYAYRYAVGLYPRFVEVLKKPPYFWCGMGHRRRGSRDSWRTVEQDLCVHFEEATMSGHHDNRLPAASVWVRIPDGIKVRHLLEAYDGYIDGLTELVEGPTRNPDGKTQYRVNVGTGSRHLVSEEHLVILLDRDNLIVMGKEKAPYRQVMTAYLRASFGEHRFVHAA